MILLEPAYKISQSVIKRRTISVIPIYRRFMKRNSTWLKTSYRPGIPLTHHKKKNVPPRLLLDS